jgi:class 3 adenylate cyclase
MLDQPIIDRLLPFCIQWTQAGEVERISLGLNRFWNLGDCAPQDVEIFLDRPPLGTMSVEWFEEITEMVLTVSCRQASDRLLRGQIMPRKDGSWVLVGRPDVSRVSDLEKVGLSLSDLPVHMGMGDLLIANEAAVLSLREAESRAEDLRLLNQSLRTTNDTFSRFVPRLFLDALGIGTPADADLGVHVGVSKCVMFADLRKFTAISEGMQSSEIFAFINEFLQAIAPSIRNHGGFVVNYLGDGIMALFPSQADSAILASIEMQQSLRTWGRNGLGFGTPDLKLGLGLHFGHLALGIVGESGRWDSTVISDAVNTASRVEGLTKVFGAGLLITRQVLENLKKPEQFAIRRLGRIPVKGKQNLIDLYEVLDALDQKSRNEKMASSQTFEEGLQAFEIDDRAKAQKCFRECLRKVPGDLAAKYYLNNSPESEPLINAWII